jgi:hypothetical protein
MSKVSDAYTEIDKLLSESKKGLHQAMKIADEAGVGFYYRPGGLGYYRPSLTHAKILAMVADGSFADLDSEDQEQAQEVLDSGHDYDKNNNYESWQTSFC